jgi:hypothetical protein
MTHRHIDIIFTGIWMYISLGTFTDTFLHKNIGQNPMVIEVQIRNPKKKKNQSSKDKVLKQVLTGLKSVNQFLETNYELSQIYYVPSSDGTSSMYQSLICTLIIHYHAGNEFKEV